MLLAVTHFFFYNNFYKGIKKTGFGKIQHSVSSARNKDQVKMALTHSKPPRNTRLAAARIERGRLIQRILWERGGF